MLVLFTIFINDLDAGVEHILSKFADDAKLGSAVDFLKMRSLAEGSSWLEHWAITNSMKFSKDQCQVLYLGWSNARHGCRLKDKRANQQKVLTVGST